MGSFDPNNMPPPPMPPEPEPEQANPWEPFERAGIDPSRFDPDDVRNGAQFWQALRNRDYQDGALSHVLRGRVLEDGETLEDLREAMRQRREAVSDPWANMQPEEDAYYDPRTGERMYAPEPQAPAFDPRMLAGAVEQTVEQKLAAFQRQMTEQRQQEARQQEFLSELNRRRDKDDLDEYESQALAGYAVQASQSNPYASTKELFDIAEKAHQAMIDRRLARVTERQRDRAPQTATPSGPVPGDAPPQSLDEAAKRMEVDLGG